MPAVPLLQLLLELPHVLRIVGEREPHDVRAADDEIEIGDVLGREPADLERALGQVDALVRAEFAALGLGPRDLQLDAIGGHRADHALDLAVVELDRLAGLDRREDLGQCAGDVRGLGGTAVARRGRRARPGIEMQHQRIARVEHDDLLERRQQPYGCGGERTLRPAPMDGQLRARLQEHPVATLAPPAVALGTHDPDRPRLAPRVRETDLIVRAQMPEPVLADGEHRVRLDTPWR